MYITLPDSLDFADIKIVKFLPVKNYLNLVSYSLFLLVLWSKIFDELMYQI